MNRKFLLLTLCLFLVSPAAAQWNWLSSSKAKPGDYAKTIALQVDDDGNSFVLGNFSGLVEFLPGQALNAPGGQRDLFLLKTDSLGQPQWAKRLGTTTFDPNQSEEDDFGRKLALTPEGDVVLIGQVAAGQVYLGVNTNNSQVNLNASHPSLLLAKYRGTDGALIWAVLGGGNLGGSGSSVAVQSNGRIAFSGEVRGSSAQIANQKFDLPPVADNENIVFIASIDASGQNLLQKNVFKGEEVRIVDLAVAATGEIFFTGTAEGMLTFENFTPTFRGAYVARANSDLQKISIQPAAHRVVGDRDPGQVSVLALGLDAQENLYIAGNFSKQMIIAGEFKTAQGSDAFLAKFHANLIPQWAITGGSASHDYALDFNISSSGHITLIGEVDERSYLAGISPFGTTKWIEIAPVSAGNSSGRAVVIKGGRLYAAGNFEGDVTLGGHSISHPNPSTWVGQKNHLVAPKFNIQSK